MANAIARADIKGAVHAAPTTQIHADPASLRFEIYGPQLRSGTKKSFQITRRLGSEDPVAQIGVRTIQKKKEQGVQPYQKLSTYLRKEGSNLPNPYQELEPFLQRAKSSMDLLPQEALSKLQALKMNQLEDNYVLLKDLPRDPKLPKTPGSEFPPKQEGFVSEFCLSLVACCFGEPYNFIQEERGNLFRNVRPTKVNESEQTSDGSKVDLELHTESAFHPFKPDYLLLYCLRGDRTRKAFTLVSSLKRIVPHLSEETMAELRKEQFITGIDTSFGNKDRTKFCKNPLPVLYGSDNDLKVNYDLDLMSAPTEEARKALALFKEAIIKEQAYVLLEPGHLVILDNKRAIHGRTAYQAFYDGYDRWLQRAYVSVDPQFAKDVETCGRIVKTEF